MEAAEAEVLRVGQLEIHPGRFALVDGRPLSLTVRELSLLFELARHADRIIGRDQLSVAAWGRELGATDRSIDVYVSKLRRKLAAALPGWRFIHTHAGFGYRFSPEGDSDPSGRLSHLFHTPVTGG